MSGCIHHLSSSHSPVFLLNSCLDLFSAPPSLEDPFSRSYGVSLPSSLAMSLSTPQYVLPGYLCRSAVRVPRILSLAVFLGSMLTCSVGFPRGGCRTIGVQLRGRICLPPSAPTAFNAHFRQRAAVSLLRHHIAILGSHGILTVSAIGLAARLSLRTRLTPGCRTSPGKP